MYLKTVFFFFLLSFFGYFLNAQNVRIINEVTDFTIPMVSVFNEDRSISMQSETDGTIDISIFSETDSIFFRHLGFHEAVFTKADIARNGYAVYLTPNEMLLEEIKIVAYGAREDARELPYRLDKIYAADIISGNTGTAADLLIQTGNVTVQKSQGGGGSPVLRGFEANKILLVVDGVRMNNAIYRGGHLQNSITVDNGMLEKVNIIYGSASVIYGSDALGGVIHYFTKKPKLAVNNAFPSVHVNSFDKYSTATNTYQRHSDFNIGYKHIASLTSISYSKYGDIKIGKNRDFSGYDEDWGKNLFYVKQFLGKDSTVANPDPLVQKRTGYSQTDFMQKIRITPNKQFDLILNAQYSESSTINRYDNLVGFKDGNLKYADWYYGPQKRLMLSSELFIKPKLPIFFTNLKFISAYQQIEESRFTRKFNNVNETAQIENLDIYSLNLDFLKIINLNRLTYGVELFHNIVNSEAYYRNVLDDDRTAYQTRYPDGGSTMTGYAAYLNYKHTFNEKNILTAGIRYSYTELYSEFLNNPELVQLPFNEVDIANGAPTGSVSYIWFPGRKFEITGTLSSGYRNPNVDDYGKIRAKDDLVTVPYDKLKPEYAYNAELSIGKIFYDRVRMRAVVFYTYLKDAIVRDYYSLNGSDSLEYDGDMYRIITNVNAGEAYIRGISLESEGDFGNLKKGNLSYKATFNYQQGQDVSNDVPLGHIPPVYGIVNLRYKRPKTAFKIGMQYNGLKKAEDMSPFGEDNEEHALEEGFPSWYIFNISGYYNFNKKIRLEISVDNIFDEHYRPFASGISAPGRNFTFGFFVNF